jgi:hypothetical protein
VFTTCFDGAGQNGGAMIDLDAPNRYRKAWTQQRVPVLIAKQRKEVKMPQNQRVVHFQYSKTQTEELNEMSRRLMASIGNKLPNDNYMPRLPGSKDKLDDHRYLRAPLIGPRAFRLKRGMILIQLLDPITQEAPRVTAHGVSGYKLTNCWNGVPFYVLDKFGGISATESNGDDFVGVREDCTAITSGSACILNNSGLHIPLSVYIYYSRMPYVTTDNQGNKVPAINTDTGDKGAGIYGQTFLPGIFYLTDNSIFSLEERIDEQLKSMFREVDQGLDLKNDDFSNHLAAFNQQIADICDQPCTSFELRQDFVLYEFAVLKAYKMIMSKVDCYNWKDLENGREKYRKALYESVSLGMRALSFFGRERADIVVNEYSGFFAGNSQCKHVLSSEFLYGKSALEKKLNELHALLSEDVEGAIEILLNERHWLNTRIDRALNMCRAEGIKILKNRYVGISREQAEPGDWFEIDVNA